MNRLRPASQYVTAPTSVRAEPVLHCTSRSR